MNIIDELFGDISAGVNDTISGIEAVDSFFGWLADGHNWVRIFEVAFGTLLLIGSFKYE